jgi:hypothetical protein
LVVVLYAVLTALVAAASGAAAWRNVAQFLVVRELAPLVEAEVLATAPPEHGVPGGWPSPARIDDVRVAAAYRDYARDRRMSLLVLGELVVLTAGAGMGATLPLVLRGGWYLWPSGVALLAALVGLFMRLRAQNAWTQIARQYELRRVQLRDVPAPAPPPAASRWTRWWSRPRPAPPD